MEKKAPAVITELVNGRIIKGIITKWEKHSIHIVTISPIPSLSEKLYITSWSGLSHYKDLRSEKGRYFSHIDPSNR